MKVLYLSDIYPFPTISGGRIRTFNLLKGVSQNNDIDFICLNDNKPAEDEHKELLNYCKSLKIIKIYKKNLLSRFFNMLKMHSDKLYFNYYSEFEDIVSECLNNNMYELIFVDSLFMYQYIISKNIDRKHTKIVLDIHNVENEILYRTAKDSKRLLVKFYSFIEHSFIKKIENKYINDCDLALVVSERDKQVYIDTFGFNEQKIEVIENGFDVKHSQSESYDEDNNEKYILFVGSLWYRPNYDGLAWFIKNVWPRIQNIHPYLKLKIVGKYSDDKIIHFNNVEYLGFVKSLDNIYRSAICSIVPLFIGSGTRLKILESFSYMIPVVSTKIGCEGLDVKHNNNILIADTDKEFEEEIGKILNNEKPFLGDNAYRLLVNKYDWNVIIKKLTSIINNIK